MTSATGRFDHEFVGLVPARLAPGRLYVSTEYAVVVHLCACGCGERVALPLDPAMWRFTFDGETVTVRPSVGNAGIACGSHYWITRGLVEWARPLSDREKSYGRERDRRDAGSTIREKNPFPKQVADSLKGRVRSALFGRRSS